MFTLGFGSVLFTCDQVSNYFKKREKEIKESTGMSYLRRNDYGFMTPGPSFCQISQVTQIYLNAS